MKRSIINLFLAVLFCAIFPACSSLDGDAREMAELICGLSQAKKSEDKQKVLFYQTRVKLRTQELEEKYSDGEDRRTLSQAIQKHIRNCDQASL